MLSRLSAAAGLTATLWVPHAANSSMQQSVISVFMAILIVFF
jgi:hypothetical protein